MNFKKTIAKPWGLLVYLLNKTSPDIQKYVKKVTDIKNVMVYQREGNQENRKSK